IYSIFLMLNHHVWSNIIRIVLCHFLFLNRRKCLYAIKNPEEILEIGWNKNENNI
ncbi:hypothetical protein ACJX0J_019966, partial [Zea mays]